MGGGDGQAPPTSSPSVPFPQARAEEKEGVRTLLRSCVLGRLLTQDGIFFFFWREEVIFAILAAVQRPVYSPNPHFMNRETEL